jgi:hypothetical protein
VLTLPLVQSPGFNNPGVTHNDSVHSLVLQELSLPGANSSECH